MSTYNYIPIELTLLAPYVTPGSKAGDVATDVSLARNSTGRLILPGSLVRGNMRAALEQIGDHTFPNTDLTVNNVVDVLFGRRPKADGTSSTGGALIFDDLVCQSEEPKADEAKSGHSRKILSRIKIDEAFGTVREGHLLNIEAPFKSGAAIVFSGSVLFVEPASKVSAQLAKTAVEIALSHMRAIGGMRSSGFGRIVHALSEVKASETVKMVNSKPAEPKGVPSRVMMSYSVDRPILVDTERPDGNSFKSGTVLPGRSIKAVIAKGLARLGEVNETAVSEAVVRDARLFLDKRLVLPVPMSIAVSADKVSCASTWKMPPAGARFSSNWKSDQWAKVIKVLKATDEQRLFVRDPADLYELEFMSRSRTSIVGKRDASGGLFSDIALSNLVRGTADLLEWRGELNLPVGQEQAVVDLLATGLPGLGKTGAVLKGNVVPGPEPQEAKLNQMVTLTLLSPAFLFERDMMAGPGHIYKAYQEVLDANGFELDSDLWFAHQVLVGGFLAQRFGDPKGCDPWCLTEPGSTFCVKVTDETKALDALNNGLHPAGGFTASDWQKFPFLRESGFGEIAADLINHAELARRSTSKETG